MKDKIKQVQLKLNNTLNEMESPANYYCQPANSSNCVVPSKKIKEWVSRLRMVENELIMLGND